jgi:hypothetical protein
VFYKRAPRTSVRRTPPTLRTSKALYLNNAIVFYIEINRVYYVASNCPFYTYVSYAQSLCTSCSAREPGGSCLIALLHAAPHEQSAGTSLLDFETRLHKYPRIIVFVRFYSIEEVSVACDGYRRRLQWSICHDLDATYATAFLLRSKTINFMRKHQSPQ